MLPLSLLKTAQAHPVVRHRLCAAPPQSARARCAHANARCASPSGALQGPASAMHPAGSQLTSRPAPLAPWQLVELKNGETYNGHVVTVDSWMNIHLREVICTSKVRGGASAGGGEAERQAPRAKWQEASPGAGGGRARGGGRGALRVRWAGVLGREDTRWRAGGGRRIRGSASGRPAPQIAPPAAPRSPGPAAAGATQRPKPLPSLSPPAPARSPGRRPLLPHARGVRARQHDQVCSRARGGGGQGQGGAGQQEG